MDKHTLNTIFILSHQMAVALEMSWTPIEMVELWPEALDGLKDARQILNNNDFPVPGVVENVLDKIDGHPTPPA